MLDALLTFVADESRALSWLPVVSADHECLHSAVCRGTNLMPSLIEFLKAQDPKEEEEKKTALLGVLREINNALQKSDGPYFGGQDVNAADLRVAPQLKHVIIGTKSLKVCTQSTVMLQALVRHGAGCELYAVRKAMRQSSAVLNPSLSGHILSLTEGREQLAIWRGGVEYHMCGSRGSETEMHCRGSRCPARCTASTSS